MTGGRFITTIRRKRIWLTVAALAPILVVAHYLFGMMGFRNGYGFAVVGSVVYVAAYLRFQRRLWTMTRGVVRGTEAGLFVDERLEVPRRWVNRTSVTRQEGTWVLRLFRNFNQLVDVDVPDEATGNALLTDMRLDAERSVAHYDNVAFGSRRASLLRRFGWCALLFASLGGVTFAVGAESTWLVLVSVVTMVGGLVGLVGETVHFAIGADGIRFNRWKGHFVPFTAIESVTLDARGNIVVARREGPALRVHAGTSRFGTVTNDVGISLVERILDGVRRSRADTSREAAALARGGRDTKTWLHEITAATDGHASFRAPARPPEVLWRVIEDPSAPPSARAGAAIALGDARDPERIRVAAEACASSRLRRALTSLARGDDVAESELDAIEPLVAKAK